VLAVGCCRVLAAVSALGSCRLSNQVLTLRLATVHGCGRLLLLPLLLLPPPLLAAATLLCCMKAPGLAKERVLLLPKLLPQWCDVVTIPTFKGRHKVDVEYFVLLTNKYNRAETAKALQAARGQMDTLIGGAR
jgi:hypothetical protein